MFSGKKFSEHLMPDTGKLITTTESGSGWGASGGTATHTTGSTEYRCRVTENKNAEVADGSQATIASVTIDFPLGTPLTSVSRIQITKRRGVTESTPKTYLVLGNPQRTPAHLTCNCREVVGNDAR